MSRTGRRHPVGATSQIDCVRTCGHAWYPGRQGAWSWRLGLYQGPKLEAASQAAYQRMPGCFPSWQWPGSGTGAPADQSYDNLRTYVMLYDPKRFNRETVWRWYESERTDCSCRQR
jgi:type VI protein secretion system component VasK